VVVGFRSNSLNGHLDQEAAYRNVSCYGRLAILAVEMTDRGWCPVRGTEYCRPNFRMFEGIYQDLASTETLLV
jgi:hypothetical protein